MKAKPAKEKAAKPTRRKSDPLPQRERFLGGTNHGFSHADYGSVFRLPVALRPRLSAAELAQIVGALGLPASAAGASAALRLTWHCAEVLAEHDKQLERYDGEQAEKKGKRAALVEFIGFDGQAEADPIPHRRFLALLKRKNPDGVTVKDRKQRGEALFREFLAENPVFLISGSDVASTLDRVRREGWPNNGHPEVVAREFHLWRARLARENMKRTKGNLNEGEKKKSAAKRNRTLARPPGS